MSKILPPAKAVKKYCLGCMGGSMKELRNCGGGCDGELYPYRMGNKRVNLKAIKIRCLECSNGEYNQVVNCHIPECELYPYRMGHNPNRKGIGKLPDKVKNGKSGEAKNGC